MNAQLSETDNLIRDISRPLAEGSFWLKLVGVMLIIYGVLTALSIIGLLIAWLPIWMGVILFQAAGAAQQAQSSGDQAVLLRAMSKLKVYFTIMGVLTLIGLVLGLVGFFMGGIGMMAAGM
ncbi:DUF5362 family protein [Alkalilimnicola sp. S0819]|uniref:DUF5362 family protein n=1 Tax=Alkalilimnicola sp. S0819 TaxID=2613922 RepID=UPI0012628D53|nr:DUF5362 family protein [Alkalilimnicola sp. S0819]KAB7624113.1 hypothetical protein F3N43_06915 [Alkalilimnicola sp. S0819]MPQ16365.1 hypothetical protein [Alkalilimnicola sp. S0819]